MIHRRLHPTDFSAYLASTPGGNLAPSSVVAYDREARSFLGDIDHRRKRFTRPYVESWLASRPMSPSTAMRALAAVKKLAEHLGLPDPTIGVRRPRSSENLPRPVEGLPFLLRRLQSDGAHVLASVVQFLASTGLRVSEACQEHGCSFTVVDEGRCLRVLGKGHKERLIPMTPHTQGLLNLLGGHIPFTVKQLQSATRLYGFNPHRLRDTFASSLAENEVDLSVIQDLLGHSSPVTTRKYTQNTLGRLRRGVEKQGNTG